MVQSCLLLRGDQENQLEGTPPTFWGGGPFINPVLPLDTFSYSPYQSKNPCNEKQLESLHLQCETFDVVATEKLPWDGHVQSSWWLKQCHKCTNPKENHHFL